RPGRRRPPPGAPASGAARAARTGRGPANRPAGWTRGRRRTPSRPAGRVAADKRPGAWGALGGSESRSTGSIPRPPGSKAVVLGNAGGRACFPPLSPWGRGLGVRGWAPPPSPPTPLPQGERGDNGGRQFGGAWPEKTCVRRRNLVEYVTPH